MLFIYSVNVIVELNQRPLSFLNFSSFFYPQFFCSILFLTMLLRNNQNFPSEQCHILVYRTVAKHKVLMVWCLSYCFIFFIFYFLVHKSQSNSNHERKKKVKKKKAEASLKCYFYCIRLRKSWK